MIPLDDTLHRPVGLSFLWTSLILVPAGWVRAGDLLQARRHFFGLPARLAITYAGAPGILAAARNCRRGRGTRHTSLRPRPKPRRRPLPVARARPAPRRYPRPPDAAP